MKMIRCKFVILFLTILFGKPAYSQTTTQEPRLLSKQSLPLAIAQSMASACIERQRSSKSSPVYVSIYDEGANPLLLLKMDGAALGAGVSAMRKAESSARFPYSSAEVAGWVKDNAGVGHIPGVIGVQGGLPIMSNSGAHLGGIGVSGAASQEDERCAQAAIDSVQVYLD